MELAHLQGCNSLGGFHSHPLRPTPQHRNQSLPPGRTAALHTDLVRKLLSEEEVNIDQPLPAHNTLDGDSPRELVLEVHKKFDLHIEVVRHETGDIPPRSWGMCAAARERQGGWHATHEEAVC